MSRLLLSTPRREDTFRGPFAWSSARRIRVESIGDSAHLRAERSLPARAARLLQLGRRPAPIAGYLRLMAALADAQQRALTSVTAPSACRQTASSARNQQRHATAREHGMPCDAPAGLAMARRAVYAADCAMRWPRARGFRRRQQQLVGRMRALSAAGARRARPTRSSRCASHESIRQPRRSSWPRCRSYWTDRREHASTSNDVPYLDTPGVCPVCGSLRSRASCASAARIDGYRYLQCGLCATEWHLVRAKCITAIRPRTFTIGTGTTRRREATTARVPLARIVRRMRHLSQDRLSGERPWLRAVRRRSRQPYARSADGRGRFSARVAASVAVANFRR